MKFINSFLFAIATFLILSCDQEKPKSSLISFDFPENGNDTLRIFKNNPLDYKIEEERLIVLDSLGKGNMKLDWTIEVFASLKIKDVQFGIFVEPGEELTLSGTLNELPNSIQYGGTSAKANEFKLGIQGIYKSHEIWDEKMFFQLDSTSFLKRQEKIRTEINELKEKYLKQFSISEMSLSTLMLENEFRLAYEALAFELVNQMSWDKDFNEFLNNEKFLVNNSFSYPHGMNAYFQSKIIIPLLNSYKETEFDSINYILPQILAEKINGFEVSEEIKEFLIAHLLRNENFKVGVKSLPVMIVYNDWEKAYPNSKYTASIAEQYKAILSLEDGIIAPELSGVSLNGDSLDLSDLKGKIVLIDVWATWCPPCVKSLPIVQELEKDFEDKEDVTFLYVSVDSKLEKWKDFVMKRNMTGLQINSGSDKLFKDYMIGGIPSYILINRDGSIAMVNAPNPGNPELREKILELL